MRPLNFYLLTVASGGLLCGPVLGQELAESAAPPSPQVELNAGDVRASNLLGAMVKRLTGEAIGEVEELIVSAEGGVRFAVISVGGILGLGAKTIAIPFEELTIAPDGATVYLSLSEEELRSRPAFDLENTNAPLPPRPDRAAAPGCSSPNRALRDGACRRRA